MDMHFHWRTRAERLEVVAYWAEQQNGVCCLCSDPELLMDDYHRQGTGNIFAATLEHLIPKRDGGRDTAGNVRLAHALCNSTLGNLWTQNEHRRRHGLEPHTIEWALTRARKRHAALIALRLAAARGLSIEAATDIVISATTVSASAIAIDLSNRRPPVQAYSPKVRNSLAAVVEAKGFHRINLPQGATLPGYVEPIDSGPPPRKAPRVRDLLGSPKKVRRPVCIACGSHDVTRDASLRWDLVAGWIIAEHRDGYDCKRCDDSTTVRFDFVNPLPA